MPNPDPANQTAAALLRLDGRCAVVTGGGRGLGLAIAHRLAEAGAMVAIGDVDGGLAASAAAEIQDRHGVPAIAAHLDVRDAASVHACADAAERELAPISIWINNAGIYPMRPIVEMSETEWDHVSDINLRGSFLGAREAARRMLASGDAPGRVILNVASVSGFRGRGGLAHYTASKHGVVGLTKSLAIELGPRGIRVLAIAPTLAATPGLLERRSAMEGPVTALEDRLAAQLPLGRIAVPDDVARVALFCVSDLAALVTGSTVFVDAGATAS